MVAGTREDALPGHEVERLRRAAAGGRRGAATLGAADLDEEGRARLEELCRRRRAGEPLQYLEGTAAFGPIEVLVDERVLIPRPETEQLWERAMARAPSGTGTVVDVGTGSGCLALAVKHRRPDLRVVATEIDPEALALARHNAHRLGLEAEFALGDLLSPLDPGLRGAVDMIVANPPYIAESEWAGLPAEVREYEPKIALSGGEDGLLFYRRLAREARPWLTPGGVLMAEIGETQGATIASIFAAAGWEAEIAQDLTGRDRFLTAGRG